MTNFFEILMELKREPVKAFLQLLKDLGAPLLQIEIDKFLTGHVTAQRRAELAGPLEDLSAAFKAGDNTAAARILTDLVTSTKL